MSDPRAPVSLGTVEGYAIDVQIVGRRACIAAGSAGLRIADVSDPSPPVVLDTRDTPDSAQGVHVRRGFVYVEDHRSGLVIVKAFGRSPPRLVGSIALPGEARAVEVRGGRACVADPSFGLHVIDVAEPTAPVKLAAFAWLDAIGPTVAAGGIVYVSSWYEGVVAVRLGPEHQPAEATP